MKIPETPVPGSLYRAIAKDYQPKQAEMKICKYIELLEARVARLEDAAQRPAVAAETEPEADQEQPKPRRKKSVEQTS